MADDAERREFERVAGRRRVLGYGKYCRSHPVSVRLDAARRRGTAGTLMIVRNTAETIVIRAALNACGSSSWNANLTME